MNVEYKRGQVLRFRFTTEKGEIEQELLKTKWLGAQKLCFLVCSNAAGTAGVHARVRHPEHTPRNGNCAAPLPGQLPTYSSTVAGRHLVHTMYMTWSRVRKKKGHTRT